MRELQYKSCSVDYIEECTSTAEPLSAAGDRAPEKDRENERRLDLSR